MSTRTGDVILFSALKKMLAHEINAQVLDPIRERQAKEDSEEEEKWSDAELAEAERAISAGVIRYGQHGHVFDVSVRAHREHSAQSRMAHKNRARKGPRARRQSLRRRRRGARHFIRNGAVSEPNGADLRGQ